MEKATSDQPLFLTRSEAADRLRIGPALLDKLIRTGDIRVVRLSRRIVIPVSSLIELGGYETPE